MEEVLQHSVKPWQEREKSWLEVFRALRISTMITVSVFTLIASLAMFNTLAMIVLEKTKDIAILRSMGYRRGDISAIFLWQGAIIAAAGSALGCTTGALLTWGVSHIPIRVRGLIVADHFLVAWDWRHYFWGTVLAIIAVFIASYVPARRAAYLPPVTTLRGSSA